MGLSNIDVASKNEYYAKLNLIKTQKEEINTIRSEVVSIKNDMQQIKELLGQLLGKGTNG
jgi:cell shape-determining protein MreC